MISISSLILQKFTDFVITFTEKEHNIEEHRISLIEDSSFDPLNAFNLINDDHTSLISRKQLQSFLLNNKIYGTNEEIDLLIQENNEENRSGISYTKFLNIIYPSSKTNENHQSFKKEIKTICNSKIIEFNLSMILSEIIKQNRILIKFRKEFSSYKSFHPI